MSYAIEWQPGATNAAAGFMADDPKGVLDLMNAVDDLANEPRPAGVFEMGQERYRLRKGRYRAVYEIHDEKVTVLVMHVGRTT